MVDYTRYVYIIYLFMVGNPIEYVYIHKYVTMCKYDWMNEKNVKVTMWSQTYA